MKLRCKQCGKDFGLTDGEIKFYKDKGLELPKRCKDCREKNKQMSSGGAATQSGMFEPADTNFRDRSSGGKSTRPAKKGFDQRLLILVLIIPILVFFTRFIDTGSNTDKSSLPSEAVERISSEVHDDLTTTQAPADEPDVQTEQTEQTETAVQTEPSVSGTRYYFRNSELLDQHFRKHGIDMGFATAEDYERAASDVINSPNALYKTEAEDGDGVYYIEATNEFVVLSTDGYIRTYFYPDSGKRYFDKQ